MEEDGLKMMAKKAQRKKNKYNLDTQTQQAGQGMQMKQDNQVKVENYQWAGQEKLPNKQIKAKQSKYGKIATSASMKQQMKIDSQQFQQEKQPVRQIKGKYFKYSHAIQEPQEKQTVQKLKEPVLQMKGKYSKYAKETIERSDKQTAKAYQQAKDIKIHPRNKTEMALEQKQDQKEPARRKTETMPEEVTKSTAKQGTITSDQTKRKKSRLMTDQGFAVPIGTELAEEGIGAQFNNEQKTMVVSNLAEFLTQPIPFGLLLSCQVTRTKESIFNNFELKVTLMNRGTLLSNIKFRDAQFLLQLELPHKKQPFLLGKVCPSFLGDQFTIFDSKNMEVGFIKYEMKLIGNDREMMAITPLITTSQRSCLSYQEVKKFSVLQMLYQQSKQKVNTFHSKGLEASTFNSSKPKMASVKNFVLKSNRTNSVIMSFSKMETNEFLLELRYPLSFIQACGIMISRIAKKIA